jgi:hypothetical protein
VKRKHVSAYLLVLSAMLAALSADAQAPDAPGAALRLVVHSGLS